MKEVRASKPISQEPKRAQWNQERIDSLVTRLAELIKDGDLVPELRPKVLCDLGGEFRNLYQLGFTARNKAKWAHERFPATEEDPSGFPHLVAEVNAILKGTNITVANTKTVMRLYHTHPRLELDTILHYRALFLQGELTKEECLQALATEHKIDIPEHQKGRFFSLPNDTGQTDKELVNMERKELEKRIRGLKKDLAADFSNLACQQGILFEAFAGAVLVHLYGVENVESQKRLPVNYCDLQGGAHRHVYLDFLIDDTSYEIKLENNLQNIAESILPQVYALEEHTGRRNKAVLVYRRKSADFCVALHDDLVMDEEAEVMGLNEVGRRLSDLVDYISIEELMEQAQLLEQEQAQFAEALRNLDLFLESTDLKQIKECAKCIEQIFKNGEAIPEKLCMLFDELTSGRHFNKAQRIAIFGEAYEASSENGDGRDLQYRLLAITKSRNRQFAKLIQQIYEKHSGQSHDELSDEMIHELFALKASVFEEYCYEVLVDQEQAHKERIKRGQERAAKYDPTKEVLHSYNRLYKRRSHHLLEQTKLLLTSVDIDERMLNAQQELKSKRRPRPNRKSESNRNAIKNLLHLLNKRSQYRITEDKLKATLHSADLKIQQSRDAFVKNVDNTILEVKGSLYSKAYFGELGQAIDRLRSFSSCTRGILADLRKNGNLYNAVKPLVPNGKQKNPKEGRVLAAQFVCDMEFPEEIAFLDTCELVADMADQVSDFSPQLAGVLISHFCGQWTERKDKNAIVSFGESNLAQGVLWGDLKGLLGNLQAVYKTKGLALDSLSPSAAERTIPDLVSIASIGAKEDIEGMEISADSHISGLLQKHEDNPILANDEVEIRLFTLGDIISKSTGANFSRDLAQLEDHILYLDYSTVYRGGTAILAAAVRESGQARFSYDTLRVFARKEKAKILAAYDLLGGVTARVVCDFYSKKAFHAKVISYFDPAKALEYLQSDNLPDRLAEKSMRDLEQEAYRLRSINDSKFEVLMQELRDLH